MLKDRLEQHAQEEVSKSPVITAPVEDKGTNTEPINATMQEDDKSVEGKTYIAI